MCPSGVLDEIMVEMQRSLPSFFRPICDQNGGRQEDDVQCLPVETKLFATVQPIETVNEGMRAVVCVCVGGGGGGGEAKEGAEVCVQTQSAVGIGEVRRFWLSCQEWYRRHAQFWLLFCDSQPENWSTVSVANFKSMSMFSSLFMR